MLLIFIGVLGSTTESDILVQQELYQRHNDDGNEFADDLIPTTFRDHQIEHSFADAQADKPYRVERQETCFDFVLHLEIEGAVEYERCENADVDADDVRPQIGHNIPVAQPGVDAEVQCSTKATYKAVQN